MRAIIPETVTDSNLASSSVTPEDPGVEWSAGTYNLGDQRWKATTHRIYEVVAASTSDDPEVGVLANPPTWIDVGPTNRWAMFDDVNSSKTIDSSTITIVITPGIRLNSLAFINISATSIDVTVTSVTGGGTVYSETVDLTDNNAITDWYQWYFAPFILKSSAVVTGIPNYIDNIFTVTIANTGGDIEVGNFIVGSELLIGETISGMSPNINDYSRKTTDDFGNTVLQVGANSRRLDCVAQVDKTNMDYVFDQLEQLRATPIVWSATDEFTSGTIFGFYRSFNPTFTPFVKSTYEFEIEGLT